MCKATTRVCQCGQGTATFHFLNNILPENVVSALYCPKCSHLAKFDARRMLKDNGWIIDYEIEGARLFAHELNVLPEQITPEFIFDEGYCSWVGYTPTDQRDSYAEKARIISLAKTDPQKYFQEIKNWTVNHVKQLAAEGWRKALKEKANLSS